MGRLFTPAPSSLEIQAEKHLPAGLYSYLREHDLLKEKPNTTYTLDGSEKKILCVFAEDIENDSSDSEDEEAVEATAILPGSVAVIIRDVESSEYSDSSSSQADAVDSGERADQEMFFFKAGVFYMSKIIQDGSDYVSGNQRIAPFSGISDQECREKTPAIVEAIITALNKIVNLASSGPSASI